MSGGPGWAAEAAGLGQLARGIGAVSKHAARS